LARHTYHRKYLHLRALRQHDWLEERIAAVQLDVICGDFKDLADRLVAIPGRYHQIAITRLDRPIDHQDVTVKDPNVRHAPSRGLVDVSGGRVSNQEPIEIDLVVLEVLGGGRKAHLNPDGTARQRPEQRLKRSRADETGDCDGLGQVHGGNSPPELSHIWRQTGP
jgi:hypothetical protein